MSEHKVERGRNSLILYESLPEKIIATKGLNNGVIFLYSEEEWKSFQERLDKLLNKYLQSSDLQSPEFRDFRIIRRHFVVPAVLIECKRRADGRSVCSLPEDLLEYLNAEEGDRVCRHVGKETDNWGSRWEIVTIESDM